jgi:Cu(I)/Ag(I) efflux system membrane protein CusA/SilA
MSNVQTTLIGVIGTVVIIILVFLWHIPSALIPVITIPAAVLISFVPFQLLGINANIMSFGGLALAIGALVDAAIVVVEQTHKKLEYWQRDGRRGSHQAVVIEAVKEVGGPAFFALLVIAVSFLPVIALEGQEGRLFRPLAYTKSLAMIVAAFLTITLDPALRLVILRVSRFRFRPRWLARTANAVIVGRIHSEETHRISRALIRVYEPVVDWSLRWKWALIGGAVALLLATIPVYRRLGSEFMPPLEEGSLLYMPSTAPGISIGEAGKLLQLTDRLIKRFPEVERVLGKAGRAETPTDPAPLSMMETVITLSPEAQWPRIHTWYSDMPEWLKPALRHITADHISGEELVRQLNEALQIPGVSNSWTMPVKGRIDMLTTGMRTPVGLKIHGGDLEIIDDLGDKVKSLLAGVAGTRAVFAERSAGGHFLDFEWDRRELARYGLSIAEAQSAIENAIGGENVTTTVEGRERYPVNVRYMRDFRSDFDSLGRVLVSVQGGRKQIPLAELATVRVVAGPSMIRDEDGLLTGYVYVDLAGRDAASFISEADRLIRSKITMQPGYSISWSGQYEAMERVSRRLKVVVPVTLALILVLLLMNTKSLTKTLIVMLAVPFSAIGAVWFLYLLGYNLSVGVWVGLIALLGVDAGTGVFMLLYLDLSYEQARMAGRMRTLADLREAIRYGAARRIRPKFMTVATMVLGLVPVMWATGAGAEVMKRIAAPMIGGICTSFLLELLIYPAVYEIWKWNFGLTKMAGEHSDKGRIAILELIS